MAIFLGYFLLTTLFLFSQSALLTLYVLALTLAYTTLLVLANRIDSGGSPGKALRTTLVMAVGGVPVMILLFALFPRPDGPLWSLNLGGKRGITGMSDHISMGSISSLSQSEETAFRVRFHGPPPPPQERYWRGLVLWHTDGRHWTRAKGSEPARTRKPVAPTTAYEVTMEPSNQPWLFPLDRVVRAQEELLLSTDRELAARRPVTQRFTYRAHSMRPPLRTPLTRRERALGLQLPAQIAPRVRKLARWWRSSSTTDEQVVAKALTYFHTQPFVYTLQPPLLHDDPVEQFLFVTHKGFCEHYATSFVLLMRLAGIPARVIIGYQGGEENPVGGHLVVRQSDAHAWAEVWLEERGWVRMDPTAAVAPERVELGITPVPAETGAPAVFRIPVPDNRLTQLVRSLGWYRDNLQLMWHYWVVGYDRSRQESLLQKLGMGELRSYQLGIIAMGGAIAIASLLFLLFGMRRSHPGDPVLIAWNRFRRKLLRAGLTQPPTMGPLDFGRTAMRRFPGQAGPIQHIVSLYIELRYGPGPTPKKLSRLRRAVSRLHLRKE
jgi:transglutaminase-like putative cysteine protease